ncbi:NADP-dependent oxidoreductase domain-containing protein [Caenorhabditis elegans]|uniref:NADP-dependent oxidoreductase domain-containing protein n=1 Tax=Caenorhabditis elegans TaxID=6239 RepID=Q17568_CAEEL|nr:NADP-dependent oxidoreductase domain-containing protein [Caenorhabditis elegans]CCD62446.1 NADP-dependent oxidoreductase domain-containing protein [Caenorhabditis elegans]|eukprot:NP_500993.1 Uncharacterized protein CELE_C01G5.5 [Caenorhabditis elegans]
MFKLKNGQEIPKLALGTYEAKGDQLFAAVDEALKVGYRSFDTAKYYENEKDLGLALKTLLPRHNICSEDIYLTSKVFPYSSKNAAELIRKDVNESLELLDRKYLDLVLVHYPRPLDTEDLNENNKMYRKDTWIALEKLHAEGKIRSIGVSNYEPHHIEEMRSYITIEPQVNQIEYHPHFQRKVLRAYCNKNEILFQAFSPLGRGNKTLLGDSTMERIALCHKTTVANVILAWIMKGKYGVVAKSVTPSRVAENYTSLSLELSDDEFEKINGLNLETPYVEDRGWFVL